jgi:hypothetical protein
MRNLLVIFSPADNRQIGGCKFIDTTYTYTTKQSTHREPRTQAQCTLPVAKAHCLLLGYALQTYE